MQPTLKRRPKPDIRDRVASLTSTVTGRTRERPVGCQNYIRIWIGHAASLWCGGSELIRILLKVAHSPQNSLDFPPQLSE